MDTSLRALMYRGSSAVDLLSKRAYIPLVDRYKDAPYASAFAEALRNQHRTPEELEALRLEKLRAVVAHCERHCEFQRERLKASGLSSVGLRSLADFRRLPVLQKAEVAEFADSMKSPVFTGRAEKAVTSGSTGISLRFEMDSRHSSWIEACVERGHGWWGMERGCRKLVLWGRPVERTPWNMGKTWAKFRARNTLQFNTFEELSDDYLASIVAAIRGFKPELIYGYASSLSALGDFMERTCGPLSFGDRPALVEYTGDHLFDAERETLQRVMGAPVVSLYGSSEAGGLALMCRAGRLHISVDHLHVEFLREDGSPTAPNERGNIVVTPLHNQRMPLLRYALGDQGSYRDDPCPCGVTLPCMNLEVDKVADRITTSTKTLVSSYVLDYINKHLIRTGVRGMRQFQVEQVGLDAFVLHYVPEPPHDPAQALDFFVAKMREYLGESIQVKLHETESIPLSTSGKRRWFKKSIVTEQRDLLHD